MGTMKICLYVYMFCLTSLSAAIPLPNDTNQDDLTGGEEERFFWENEDVGKPVNFYHGAAYQIPVIEGEIVKIDCKVRAVSEDPYTIIWDFENFHANTTGKTVLVNNTDGDEFAQDTITVNIDNPIDIDDKDIICSWENGKFSDTITLQFKVYVPDNNSQHCEDECGGQGDDQLRLKRPEIQKKEDINLEEKIKQKVMRENNVGEVFIDSNDYICACKPTLVETDIPEEDSEKTEVSAMTTTTSDFPIDTATTTTTSTTTTTTSTTTTITTSTTTTTTSTTT